MFAKFSPWMAQVYFAKGLSFSLEILKPTEYNPQSPVGAAVAHAQDYFLEKANELSPSELCELWSRSLKNLEAQIEHRDQWRQHEEEWTADADSSILQFVVFDSQTARKYYEKKKLRMFSAHPSATGMESLSELDVLLSEDSTGQIWVLFDQHLIQAVLWLKKLERLVCRARCGCKYCRLNVLAVSSEFGQYDFPGDLEAFQGAGLSLVLLKRVHCFFVKHLWIARKR